MSSRHHHYHRVVPQPKDSKTPSFPWTSFLRINKLLYFFPPKPKIIIPLISCTSHFFTIIAFVGSIPQEVANLQNLLYFYASSNALSGSIPSEIFNMSKLEELYLFWNNLSGTLPPTFGVGLPNLKQLSLHENKLSGIIPSSISNASMITLLDLASNSFTSFIPTTLGNLRFLEILNLENNSLTTESSTPEFPFLTSLTNCRFLRYLYISLNPLNGILPISIGNFSISLVTFQTAGCNIKGNIPKEIANLSNLISLQLGSNELSGPLPPTVGRLQNLQSLALQYNKLQGSFPDDICLLKRLFYLDLGGNELPGPISICINNLTSLQDLYLGDNKFNSTIPPTLSSLTYILEINLSANSLSGSIPWNIIGSLKAVRILDLSRNQFSSDVLSTIGSLQDLVSLSLAYNRLQGPISQSFKDLVSLEFLDLSHNNFSGVIPKSLEKLKYLQNLNVSYNSLHGEIPDGGPFANFSAGSFMMNDALCGASRLLVPQCKIGTPRQSRKIVELLLEYALPLIVIIFLVLLVMFIRYRKRNARIPIHTKSLNQAWRRISHHELLQATNGFNESNLLGNGSFGSIYKGILLDGINVAIKVFNLQIEGAFKSFDAECEVLRNIRHRNLIKIISTCSNNLDKALVIEYMPNGSLEKWLYSHNYFLDILQRLNIMINVAMELEYLHRDYTTPIVHCDLKPSNILLDGDMVAHVGDFGISKLLGEGELMTQTMTLATVGYMAPEYGSEGIVSTRGDVYSYGILLIGALDSILEIHSLQYHAQFPAFVIQSLVVFWSEFGDALIPLKHKKKISFLKYLDGLHKTDESSQILLIL